MTVIRLLDSTKVYLHAVIDSFSRRILAWRVTENFSVGRRWRSYRRWIGEMYYGLGQEIPDQLECAKRKAQAARLEANRAAACGICRSPSPSTQSCFAMA